MTGSKGRRAETGDAAFWPTKRVKFADPAGLVRIDDDGFVVPPPDGWEAIARAVSAGAYDQYLNAGTPWTDRRYRDEGPTLLYVFSRQGAADVVRALLGRGADPRMRGALPRPKNTRDVTTFPAVVGAAYGGNAEVLRLLLDAGASADDGTPLSAAISEGHDECFQVLVERGADVTAKVPWGNGTLLEKAVDLGRSNMATEIRKRVEAKRRGTPVQLLRPLKKRVKTPAGPFSGFARARWAAHLSWVVFAIRGSIEGLAKAIGAGSVVERAATTRVVGREVTFLLQMKSSNWTWYLWRPELHHPAALASDIEEQREMALDISARTSRAVLIFRDTNVDRVERGKVTPIFEGRWPPFTLSEYGDRSKIPGKDALAAVDALCAKEGIELPHLVMGNDGFEWVIEVVNYPIENIARVDAIISDEPVGR